MYFFNMYVFWEALLSLLFFVAISQDKIEKVK